MQARQCRFAYICNFPARDRVYTMARSLVYPAIQKRRGLITSYSGHSVSYENGGLITSDKLIWFKSPLAREDSSRELFTKFTLDFSFLEEDKPPICELKNSEPSSHQNMGSTRDEISRAGNLAGKTIANWASSTSGLRWFPTILRGSSPNVRKMHTLHASRRASQRKSTFAIANVWTHPETGATRASLVWVWASAGAAAYIHRAV